jgi:hypothetical protein
LSWEKGRSWEKALGLPSGFEGIENDRRLCRWVASAHVIFLALVAWQLGEVLIHVGEIDGRHVAFAFIAVFLALPATPLFWGVRKLGWVLLFLADSSALLQAMSNMSRGWRTGSILWSDLLGAGLAMVMVLLLFIPRVFGLFAGGHLRYWGRAARRSVRVRGALTLFGDHRAEGILTDVSLSGCSFISNRRIPLAERVRFRQASGPDEAEVGIRVVRELSTSEKEYIPTYSEDREQYPFCYGGEFVTAVTDAWFHRLQEDEPRNVNPG